MRKKNVTSFLTVFAFLFLGITNLSGATIYVDLNVPTPGSGTSWNDAYQDLQDALAASVSGDTIFVATGVYYPTQGTNRNAHFALKNGIKLIGGFDPANGVTTIPDWVAYPVYLSGNIGDPKVPTDNCYHVFYHENSLALDHSAQMTGFNIIEGYADQTTAPHNGGAGMYNDGCSPQVAECNFKANYSYDRGGAMVNINNADGLFLGVTFFKNKADMTSSNGFGGAVYNYNSDPEFYTCTFNGNIASNSGGAIANFAGSEPRFGNTTIQFNEANMDGLGTGGGVYNIASSPFFYGTTFEGNQAPSGGGMSDFNGSLTKIEHSLFTRNTALRYGGGYLVQSAVSDISKNTFSENEAETAGGGICYLPTGAILFKDNTLSSNNAGDGGGMAVFGSTNGEISGCELYSNDATAGYGGGAIYFVNSSTIDIRQCTLIRNNSNMKGGAILLQNSSNINVMNNTISSNKAETGGGICINNDYLNEHVDIVNNLLDHNEARRDGGGLAILGDYAIHSVINSNTIADNIAGSTGGGIFSQNQVYMTSFSNNIIYFNGLSNLNQILVAGGAYTGFRYCDIQYCGGGFNGNIDMSPRFVGQSNQATQYRLSYVNLSPCIDAGNNTAVMTSTDNKDDIRILNGIIDMGTYEYEFPTPAYRLQGETNLEISVYPNPTQGLVLVEASEILDIHVYDNTGKLVYQQSELNTNQLRLDMSAYSKGTYFLHITTSTDTHTQQVVLTK